MAYGILWVQQKLHKKSLPLLSAFHPIFKFSRKNHRWNMSPKKTCHRKHLPKAVNGSWSDRDRDRLAAEANLYEFMKSRVGGPSTDGAVGCDGFFSQEGLGDLRVFFCLENICLLRDGDWNIRMGFKSSPMKKNASNILKGEAFWVTFFYHPYPFQLPIQGFFSSYPPKKIITDVIQMPPKQWPFQEEMNHLATNWIFRKYCRGDPSPGGRETAESLCTSESWPVKFRSQRLRSRNRVAVRKVAPLKIDMEHVLTEVCFRSFFFLDRWFLASSR